MVVSFVGGGWGADRRPTGCSVVGAVLGGASLSGVGLSRQLHDGSEEGG
jgi:hypothetical protein